ncbi:type 1 fimbria pilin [Paraburkholderia sp. BL25I1N1]|nr:type 1 fimbria pilin [Paraburkholderia sp. BL25I1N1]
MFGMRSTRYEPSDGDISGEQAASGVSQCGGQSSVGRMSVHVAHRLRPGFSRAGHCTPTNGAVGADSDALAPYLTPHGMNTSGTDPKGSSTGVEFESAPEHAITRCGAAAMLKYKTATGRAALIRVRCPDREALPSGAEALHANSNHVGVVAEATRCDQAKKSPVTGFVSRYLKSPTAASMWMLLVSSLCMSEAKADCSWLNGQTTENYTFNIPALTVSRDAAEGRVLYTSEQYASPSTQSFATCSGNTPANRTVTGGAQVRSNPYTFATNVPGIGMRFFHDAGGSKSYWGAGNQEYFNGSWGWSGAMLGVEVVVTGPVAAGTIDGALVGTFRLGSLTVANLRVTPASVAASTCSVVTQTLPVTLPTVRPRTFLGIGSTAGAQVFSIDLDCTGPNAAVFVTLTDNTSPTNRSGILSLTPESSAQGVGLQILIRGNPVSFGADSAVAGNPNQTFAGTAGVGLLNIPLIVRYMATSMPVGAGTVGAVATFTMSYQ